MKAARFYDKGDIRIEDIPEPTVAPGTVGINWRWSLKKDYLLELDAKKLQALCVRYHR